MLAIPIVMYQAFIRPFRGSGAPTCRYEPSCSAYGIEALRVWGPVRGSWLLVKRLARCQPWGGVGLDPVPTRDVPIASHPVVCRSSARTLG